MIVFFFFTHPTHLSHLFLIFLSVTPSDTLVRRSISQQKSGVSVTIDDPVRTSRQPSPPRGKISNIIHVTNLVRNSGHYITRKEWNSIISLLNCAVCCWVWRLELTQRTTIMWGKWLYRNILHLQTQHTHFSWIMHIMWMPVKTTIIPIIRVRSTYPGINAVAKHLLKLRGTVHD